MFSRMFQLGQGQTSYSHAALNVSRSTYPNEVEQGGVNHEEITNLVVRVNPGTEDPDATYSEFKFSDPQFYNLIRLAFGMVDEKIKDISIYSDHIRVNWDYGSLEDE